MGIAVTKEQRDLADSVREFTARHAPRAQTRAEFADLSDGALGAAWAAVRAQGYLGIHLPESAGGDGGGITELAVLLEESARGLLPGPLLPTVLTSLAISRFGPAALLPAFAGGATAGCVTTPDGLRATRAGDGWRVSGTSAPALGALSGQFLLLGADTPDGAIWFITPSGPAGTLKAERASGADLTRDIGHLTLAGHLVPDDLLVGAPGDGWRLARTTLGDERVSIGSGRHGRAEPPALIARRLGVSGASASRDVGRLTAWLNAADALARRGLLQRLGGARPGAEGSVLKLTSSLVMADVKRAALAWAGPAAAVLDGGGGAAQAYLSVPPTLIGGGTAEIQLNVIAEHVLGLPREAGSR